MSANRDQIIAYGIMSDRTREMQKQNEKDLAMKPGVMPMADKSREETSAAGKARKIAEAGVKAAQ